MICRRFVPKITNHREHFASILAKSGGLSFVATPGELQHPRRYIIAPTIGDAHIAALSVLA